MDQGRHRLGSNGRGLQRISRSFRFHLHDGAIRGFGAHRLGSAPGGRGVVCKAIPLLSVGAVGCRSRQTITETTEFDPARSSPSKFVPLMPPQHSRPRRPPTPSRLSTASSGRSPANWGWAGTGCQRHWATSTTLRKPAAATHARSSRIRTSRRVPETTAELSHVRTDDGTELSSGITETLGEGDDPRWEHRTLDKARHIVGSCADMANRVHLDRPCGRRVRCPEFATPMDLALPRRFHRRHDDRPLVPRWC